VISEKIEDTYNKAIILLDKPKSRLTFKMGKEKIDISHIMNNTMLEVDREEQGNLFNQILEKYNELRLEELDEYYQLFNSLKDCNTSDKIIQKYIEDLIYYRKQYIVEPKDIKLKPYKKIRRKDPFKLLQDIERDLMNLKSSKIVDYVDDAYFDKELQFIFKNPKTINRQKIKDDEKFREKVKNSYTKTEVEKDLKEFKIHPNTLKNSYFKDDKLDHQKNLFINLSFYLGLDLHCAESLLNVNGYTIKNSLLKKDKILARCFKIGFGQEYTEAILDKQGYKIKRKYSR